MSIERWLPVILVVFVLGLVVRSPYLTAFSAILCLVIGVAAWWQRHSLDGIRYRRRFHYTRGFPEEEFPVQIEIENQKILPLTWLNAQDPWPYAVGPVDENILASSHIPDQGIMTHAFSLRWFERSRRTYNLLLRNRGVYPIGPARVQSGDIFGMYERSGSVGEIDRVTVFPKLLPPAWQEMPPVNPLGDQRSRKRLLEDANVPIGVREYQPDDDFRRVHWPATAKTGLLQVRVYQPTSAQVLVVCLNVMTYTRHWEGYYPAMFERLLSLAGTLLYEGMQLGYRVGLISNGCQTNADQPFRVPPGRSPEQLGRLLGALAGATPVVALGFENYLLKEIPRVPYGSTLLVLTAITSQELIETLVHLKKHERQITLLSLAEEPPLYLPGITVIHRPFRENDVN